ncbi:MAG: hypothetical protein ABSB19_12055 [Methylomonas sp.]|jgi:uncharacterized membrane protein
MNTPPVLPEKTSLGIDANLAAVLTYVLGFFSGIAFLILEKENKFVRFHALQSTLAFVFLMVIKVALSVIPVLGALVILFLVWPVTVALWLVLMYKAYNYEKFKLPIFGDIAEKQIG